MKKQNKKGFTIVELVIVVAVIAILAAVLIPTFSNVIADANDAALRSELKSLYTEYVAEVAPEGKQPADTVLIVIDGVTYEVKNGAPVDVTDGYVAAETQLKTDGKCSFVNGQVFEGTHATSGKCENCGETVPQ